MLKTLKKVGISMLSLLLACSAMTFVPVSAEETLINKAANEVTVESYSSQCGGEGEPLEGGGTGQAYATVDYNEDTYWHSNYNTNNGEKHTITYNLGKEYTVTSVKFLPRKGLRNGDIHKLEVYVGNNTDYTQNVLTGEYVFATSGTLTEGQWYTANVAENGDFVGEYVTIRVTGSYGDTGNNKFASMGEIRFYGTEYVEPEIVDKAALVQAIADAQEALAAEDTYTVESFAAFKSAYDAAVALNENADATQANVNNAVISLTNTKAALTVKPRELTDLINKAANEVTVESYSSQCGGEREPYEGSGGGQAYATVDYNEDTYWHSNYNTNNGEKHTITYNLGKEYTLKDVTFLPRKGGRNGDIHKFEVYVGNSTDYTQNTLTGEYVFATSGTLTEGQWYRADVLANGEFTGQYVTIRITGSYGQSSENDLYASMSEIRFYGTEVEEPQLDVSKLELVVLDAEDNYGTSNPLGQYAVASFAAYEAAYTAALAVISKADNNEELTQEEIDDAKAALEAAMTGLVTLEVLKENLAEAKNVGEASEEWAQGYNKFMDPHFAGAEAALAKEDATQAEIDAADEALATAVGEAVEFADAYEEVLATIVDAETADTEGKTEESVAALQAAITAAYAALEAEATDTEALVAQIEALNAAVAGLEDEVVLPSYDKTALKAAIDAADAIFAALGEANLYDVYTEDSALAFEIAYEEAKLTYEDDGTDYEEDDYDFQAAIDAATETLAEATAALEENEVLEEVDKEALVNFVEDYEELYNADNEEGIYTAESFAVFKAAYEAALAIIDNDATQAEVDAATEALEAAIDALAEQPAVPAVDKAALKAALDAAYALNVTTDKYTEESVEAFDVAYSEAAVIYADEEEVSQEAVDEATAALLAAIDGLKEIEIVEVDKEALLAVIEEAEEIIENADAYTVESYVDFKAAYDAAVVVLDNVDATQEAVDNATTALEAAIEALEEKPAEPTVDKTALEAAIAAADALDVNTDNYTIDSVEAFDVAYSEAIIIFADEEATQEAVDEATALLEAAIEGLTPYEDAEIDKDALLAALEEAEEIIANADAYTPESFADFKAAYDAAVVVADNDDATQAEIDNATATLVAGIEALVEAPTVDKTALEAAIAAADALNVNDEEYTVESVEAFDLAYSEAVLVFTEEEATQEAVDEATQALLDAIEGLEKIEIEEVDKEALLNALDDAEEIIANADAYTEESYAAFKAVYDAAVVVADNKEATQAEVDATVEALATAVAALEEVETPKADKAALEALIAEVEALKEADYSKKSWSNLQTALAAGKDVVADVNATQEGVDAAKAELETRKGKLVSVVALREALAAAEEKLAEADKYTEDSVTALRGMYDNANTVLNSNFAYVQDDADMHTQNVINAISALIKKQPEPTVNKDTLAEAIARAEAKLAEADKYTDETVAVLETQLANAKDVMDNADATQMDVDQAVVRLNAAIKALAEKPVEVLDTKPLVDKIAEAKEFKEDEYYAPTFAALEAAIKAAKKALATVTTNAQVAEEVEKLQAVIDALIARPDRVVNLSAKATNYKTIQLKWDAVEGATYYQIYRLNTQTGKWIKFKKSTTNSYKVTGVKTGVKYSYRVIANKELADGAIVAGKPSSTKSATALLQGEPVLTMKANGKTKFDLSWTKVAGATRYLVYRKSETAGWKKVLTLSGSTTTYTTSSMVPNTYTYMIKAARYDSKNRTQTNGSNTCTGTAVFSKPVITVTKASSTSAKVAWKAVEGVKYYEVYRATSKSGTYSKLKTTENLSFTSKSLKAGKKYYYKVRAYRTYNNGKVYTSYSKVVEYKA